MAIHQLFGVTLRIHYKKQALVYFKDQSLFIFSVSNHVFNKNTALNNELQQHLKQKAVIASSPL